MSWLYKKPNKIDPVSILDEAQKLINESTNLLRHSFFDDISNHRLENISSKYKSMFSDMADSVSGKIRSYLDDEHYVFDFAVPGFSKDDVEVTVDEKSYLLQVKGSKSLNDKHTFINSSITLESDSDIEKISCHLENGLLIVKVPKIKDKPKSTKVLQITTK